MKRTWLKFYKSSIATLIAIGLTFLAPGIAHAEQTTLFSENFDSLATKLPPAQWTHDPPAGWKLSNAPAMPQGDAPWQGWSFTTVDVWKAADANIQLRDLFALSSGVFAIADPDEWDDVDSPSSKGTFNSTLATPAINVAGAENLKLTFDSHWRPDGGQTGLLLASFDGGNPVELLHYDSKTTDDSGSFLNKKVTLDFSVPKGTRELVLSWQLFNAGNNWYWAIDNISLTGEIVNPTPVCEAPYILNPTNKHCYGLTDVLTWPQAQKAAMKAGGNLATINDEAEQSWLLDTFGTQVGGGSAPSFWIGFTDVDSPGTYKWVNGEPDTFKNWNTVWPEPNNYQNLNEHYADFCAQVGFLCPKVGVWNDRPDGWPKQKGIVERS